MDSLTSYDTTQLAIILVSLLASAFFSGTETAITSLGSLKAKHLVDQNGAAKRQLNLWLNHPARVLTTILIFNNFFHILASAVATDFASRHLQSQAIGIATGVMTLLILFFVEIIPKSFARTHAERIAVPTLRVIYVIYVLMIPIVWLVSEFAARVVSKLGGVRQENPPITEEELEYLVNVGERAGVLEETKKEMIVGVFEFDETKVREIMTPRPDVKWLNEGSNLSEALVLAVESGMSRIPVCENASIDNVVGILLVKDLLKVARDQPQGGGDFNLKMIMRAPFFVPESKPVMDVFKELKSSKNHIAVVIDEHGGTAGVVTMEDILEEIVGEIQDEYDTEEAEILELEPGIHDVAGSCNIDEFLEYFDIDENTIADKPDDGIDTLAGWIVALLGELPEIGKTLRIGPLNVEVTDVERQRIRRVRVSLIMASVEKLSIV
ncbi:MAG: hemolysin family protein [Proteobacteria bacterium]|nr:hemolysin family protein [Pseudomonadota bacterium]